MKKKGFTLVEVVVSILLVVMLIGMTYGAITVSLRYSSKYDLQRDALHEIQNLRTLLRTDNIPAALNLYIGCDSRDPGHQTITGAASKIILYYGREGTLLGWDDGAPPSDSDGNKGKNADETPETTAAPYVPLRERAAWKITLTRNDSSKIWTLGKAETAGGTVLYEEK